MKRECSRNLRAWEVAILMALSFTLCVGLWAQRTQDAVSAQVLRLHVLAVDYTAEEQALKLRVRDAVLSYLEPTLEGVEDRDAAREIVANHLQEIAETAASAAEGRSVQVSLGEESYPLRRYESMVLPAGRYKSLRVVLGEGRGQNWWCVVFPPICLSAAEMDRAQETMGAEEFALVTEADGYELRFRIVELWGELQRWFENR